MLTILPAVEVRAIEKLRQEELEEARAVQKLDASRGSSMRRPATVTHEFQPVDIVGGDFVDYFLMDNGNVGFYVGDVSGKGLPAAMYAAFGSGNLAKHPQNRSVTERNLVSAQQTFDESWRTTAPRRGSLRRF